MLKPGARSEPCPKCGSESLSLMPSGVAICQDCTHRWYPRANLREVMTAAFGEPVWNPTSADCEFLRSMNIAP